MERIFKARYYPRSSVMDAKLGFQPSYAWRSILSAKEIISQGSRWQECNGSKIRIWCDNWLPEQSGFKVLSPRRLLNENACVGELIDYDAKRWNRDTILTNFTSYEAKQILSIQLSFRLLDR